MNGIGTDAPWNDSEHSRFTITVIDLFRRDYFSLVEKLPKFQIVIVYASFIFDTTVLKSTNRAFATHLYLLSLRWAILCLRREDNLYFNNQFKNHFATTIFSFEANPPWNYRWQLKYSFSVHYNHKILGSPEIRCFSTVTKGRNSLPFL